ncbi:MAG: thioredoxin family protein [Cyanobacteria bacterium HKST-UBA06]|nr:thioredoxin family protein [Cyanobacteria bacterium HKST-UBA04]MCA9807524.1 thioredoxin family protein [Cyanobacteria bacterium HKST-UBA06]MCA9841319.1 thioredoxin family protein [Cyanobacteria bacterium HKST-UBA03]
MVFKPAFKRVNHRDVLGNALGWVPPVLLMLATLVVLGLCASTPLLVLTPASHAASESGAGGSRLLMLEADWCAYCRELNPAITSLVSGYQAKGLAFEALNVDQPADQAKAATYGISIKAGQLPVVYLMHNSSVTLLYDGKNYTWGQAGAVTSDIRKQLDAKL